MITRVPPGTWETLSFPSSQAAGDTAYQLQIDPRLRVRGRGGRTTDATMVSPSEGNEARRNGRQGVAAPHSTVEAGEPTRGTPSRERSEANCLTRSLSEYLLVLSHGRWISLGFGLFGLGPTLCAHYPPQSTPTLQERRQIFKRLPSARQLVRDDRWDAQDRVGCFPVDSALG